MRLATYVRDGVVCTGVVDGSDVVLAGEGGIGLQLIAVAPELQLAIDDEMLAAQDVKRLVRRPDIGGGFLDNASQLRKTPRRVGTDFTYFAIDRRTAIIVSGKRDALWYHRSAQPGAE